MNKKIVVKQWDGIRSEFEITASHNYDDFTKMLSDHNGLDTDSKFKFICEGKIITNDNFHTLKSKSIMMAFLAPNLAPKKNDDKLDELDKSKSNEIEKLNGLDKTKDTKESRDNLYNFKQIKTSMIVFLEFIKNNPQLDELYKTDYSQLVVEIVMNPVFDDIIKNILSQSSQISESMENCQNIQVDLSKNSDSHQNLQLPLGTNETNETNNVELNKIELSNEDTINIDEIISMGFDANLVCKTYVEIGLSNGSSNGLSNELSNHESSERKVLTSTEKKELTLKKLLGMFGI
jgi:hypothetical protein